LLQDNEVLLAAPGKKDFFFGRDWTRNKEVSLVDNDVLSLETGWGFFWSIHRPCEGELPLHPRTPKENLDEMELFSLPFLRALAL
jgi:hypothetical protein